MSKNFSSTQEFKLDILSKLYNKYPNSNTFTEQEYGCYLFDSQCLFLSPDSADTLRAIERLKILTKTFQELRAKGLVNFKRTSHMSWSAELTHYGYHFLRDIYSESQSNQNVIVNRAKSSELNFESL